MIGIVIFNVFMIAVGAGVASQIVPKRLFSPLLIALHNTIGITTPPPEKLRMFALIWIASLVVLVDGLLFLLVFLAFELR